MSYYNEEEPTGDSERKGSGVNYGDPLSELDPLREQREKLLKADIARVEKNTKLRGWLSKASALFVLWWTVFIALVIVLVMLCGIFS